MSGAETAHWQKILIVFYELVRQKNKNEVGNTNT